MPLDIIYYGHPALRSKGSRIEKITPEIHELAAQMIEAMYEHDGCGLAAQQVGRSLQLAVVDVAVARVGREARDPGVDAGRRGVVLRLEGGGLRAPFPP